ncbi:molybdate ABC transporter substrate-binding protein [Avibacterium sp. 20-129]|uniref:molybdate ABC transporter substrate-binding protein n=1 Tax=Avibacterium sp. 20-129 TaxID=2911525 RepID=UPI00224613C1|nr:molybdate ABC transporter substrate-binding protein [Avibacterium sp. 20-129]MCW9698356.1 molybdate ABC transporter substrate-binding protein [Avibacterium sp. 20-129]
MLKLKTFLCSTLLACSLFSIPAQAKLTIFAAASMTNVLEEVKTQYLATHPKEEIDFSFASSSVLARQISQGAPADIFISANQKWMDFLAEKNVIEPKSRVNLVQNSLVMIAPKNSRLAQIDVQNAQWQGELKGSYLAVGDPAHVPAGKYAQEALTSLNQWQAVENKLARANNVRAALALVEQGEAPLGIVYGTDAEASQKVKVVAVFPENSHAAIEYPAAIVVGHSNQERVDFLAYLQSEEAKKIFLKAGFVVK